MSTQYLSTGQVAARYAVTPDAVLKWIKSGKIPATKTPGGHCRIPEYALKDIEIGPEKRERPYCWEHKRLNGHSEDNCHGCLICQVRAENCYLLNRVLKELKYSGPLCHGQCSECDYYRNRISESA